jgi:hypothetical protein
MSMKATLLSALFCLMLLDGNAQSGRYDTTTELRGSGRLVSETPTVDRFDVIEIRQFPANVTVDVGGSGPSVSITVDDNLRPFLRVSSRNGTLTLSFADPQGKPFWISKANVSVQIRTPTLTRLTNGSNGSVRVNGVQTDSFTLINDANGNVTLRGRTGTFAVVSKANGTVDASGLIAQKATVETEANATIRVNAQSLKTTKRAFATITNVANPPEAATVGQTVADKSTSPLITVRFLNNSARARPVTLISYAPGDEGNETNGFTLAPYASRPRQYAVGTVVYAATKEQVDLVMSGGRLRGKPLLTVAAGDNGRTIKLNP